MRQPPSDLQLQFIGWLGREQQTIVPHPLVLAKTKLTTTDARSASIITSLSVKLDQPTLDLCVRATAQAFVLGRTGQFGEVEAIVCKLLEPPKGKALWAEAVTLERRGNRVRCAVDVTDQRDCRVGVGDISLFVEGAEFS
jgi:hypothetical protein